MSTKGHQSFGISTTGERSSTKAFDSHDEYLQKITTGINLNSDSKLVSIVKALSNKYMSMMVVSIEGDSLKKLYEGKSALIRCYNEKKQFFELALKEIPLFIDIFNTTIAYILPSQHKENTFSVIDVGQVANEERSMEAIAGQTVVRDIEHEFEEEIIGFKLGYFINPTEGNLKAVMWSNTKAFVVPFNPDESKEDEYTTKQEEVQFEIMDEIERIYDFGARQGTAEEYDDLPEFFLLTDTEQSIHIMKGNTWGKSYGDYHVHKNSDMSEKHEEVEQIFSLCLVQCYKVVGLIEKTREGSDITLPVVQIFEFDPVELNSDKPLKMTRDFDTMTSQLEEEFYKKFSQTLIMDDYNNCFYMNDNTGKEHVFKLMLNNNISNKCEHIQMNGQIAMNLVGNNTKYSNVKGDEKFSKSYGKTRGLLYHDFCCADNLLVLLHGKVVSCFDLMDKTNSPGHYMMESSNPKDPYNLDNQPIAVWMMDKNVKETYQRYKIIVAFKDGNVKELIFHAGDKTSTIEMKDYLMEDRKFTKLPGRIVKTFRDRNSTQQPVYFLLKLDESDKKVFATIEFQSQTFRYFEIPGTNNNTTYIVNDIADQNKQWQEVICINTLIDKENNNMDQKLIHAKVRIGQYKLTDKNKEFFILNKEDLQPDMENVQIAQDIFVSNGFIYFIHKKSVDKYCIADNSHQKINVNENLYKMLVFENKFFYWRTVLGGFNDNRYQSKIYFDGLQNFSQLRQQCSETDVEIFSGIYPHINKLQYDSMSDSVACFTNFHTIKVFPMLHSPRIKVKVAGKRSTDTGILATQLVADTVIVTLHADNVLRAWNLRTGKYMLVQKALSKDDIGDFSLYQYHQRIDDQHTLIRSKRAITDDFSEAVGKFHPKMDWSDEQNDIKMYKYKIIKLNYDLPKQKEDPISPISPKKKVHARTPRQKSEDVINNLNTDSFTVKVERSFVGPHDTSHVNFGLYVGNDLNLLAFFWKDSQDKLSLRYSKFSPDLYVDDDEPNVEFHYTTKETSATPENSKLSIHSPNFRSLIEDIGQKDYKIYQYDDAESGYQIPQNLCQQTIDYPNFLTNNQLVFLTEDNIIKSYNFESKQEEFMVTHCEFPGSVGAINLATLLKVGNHVIGENCLTYEQTERMTKKGIKKDEFIAPNNFNYFFLDAAKEHEESEEYNEVKIIQCHYKSKIELASRSYYGYFFNHKELEQGCSNELYIISTYSYYNWRMLYHLEHKKISIEDLNQDQIRNLSYVQLPNGSTLLHCIYQSKSQLEYVYTTVQDPEDEGGVPFHIPLLKNQNNRTALDLAMNIDNVSSGDSQARMITKFIDLEQVNDNAPTSGNKSKEAINRKQTEEILKNIGQYPFGLFKVQIKKKLVEKMIEEEVMEFGCFIDNCAKTPSFLRVYDRAKVEVEETCGAKVFETTNIWTDTQEELSKRIEDKKADEKLVTLKVLDLPFIHHYTNSKNNYIYQSLAKTENSAIFEKTAIKALIEQKWALTKYHIILYLLLPYLCFLGVMMYFTIFNLEDNNIAFNFAWDSLICRMFILFFVVYFSYIEFIQLMAEGIVEHISDFWNYLDILPPILIITAEILALQRNVKDGATDEELAANSSVLATIRSLYAFTAIAMWLRFLYFFRIFRSTGYYIHMIVKVVIDMSQFFFIFAIVVVSFGHANYIISHNDAEGPHALDHLGEDDDKSPLTFFRVLLIQYRNCIGDIQDGSISSGAMYSELVGWVFLIICSLLVIIVLLNLLISIVGSTFGEVQDSKAQMTYMDLVQLIVENQFLISEEAQDKLNQGKYLMLVVPEDQDELEQQKLEQGMMEIRMQMRNHHNDLIQKQKDSSYQNERILKALKKVQEQVESRQRSQVQGQN